MKKKRFWSVIMIAQGLAGAEARADERRLTCTFHDEQGRTECTALLRICPLISWERCGRKYEVTCNGKIHYSDSIFRLNVSEQNGIGHSIISARDNGYPHIALDTALENRFKNVFAHLYLSPEDRLFGWCDGRVIKTGDFQ